MQSLKTSLLLAAFALAAGIVCASAAKERPEWGASCDPDDCELEGECLEYWWCEREVSDHKGTGKNGTWMNAQCDEETGPDNLYWNPNRNGGSCDFWENLDQETKDEYNNDDTCINPHCEWKADGPCSSSYWYFHPLKNDGVEQKLNCPVRPDGETLVWDQVRKSCHSCDTVDGPNGKCCNKSKVFY